jgi:hypothetical protein
MLGCCKRLSARSTQVGTEEAAHSTYCAISLASQKGMKSVQICLPSLQSVSGPGDPATLARSVRRLHPWRLSSPSPALAARRNSDAQPRHSAMRFVSNSEWDWGAQNTRGAAATREDREEQLARVQEGLILPFLIFHQPATEPAGRHQGSRLRAALDSRRGSDHISSRTLSEACICLCLHLTNGPTPRPPFVHERLLVCLRG